VSAGSPPATGAPSKSKSVTKCFQPPTKAYPSGHSDVYRLGCIYLFNFIFVVLVFELRALHLLGRHFTTSVMPPAP
jgi:hypothetical protein